jgi:hypothetical protein
MYEAIIHPDKKQLILTMADRKPNLFRRERFIRDYPCKCGDYIIRSSEKLINPTAP